MKFDVVFSNPPYTKNVDIKILNDIIDCAEEFVIVHPSTPILQYKDKFKPYLNFKKIKGFRSFEFFNGNKIFDIGLFVPCMVTHIQKSYTGKILVKFYDQVFNADVVNDVTKYGSDWETLVKPFVRKLETYFTTEDNLWSHNQMTIDDSKFYVQLSGIRGNVSKNDKNLVDDDFYTMCGKNPQMNIGIRQRNLNRTTITPLFVFDTEEEQKNFLDYLCTDFARFCLSISKINGCIFAGELEMLPWLDFTESWDDDKLYQKFDVSDGMKLYINSFLPDYHGIRP